MHSIASTGHGTLGNRRSSRIRISFVIPTLEEERAVGGAVRSAWEAGADEVIVADGGSRDGTAREAKRQGARVVRSVPGRGRQLNVGAQAAGGDVLCFLHADARLAPGAANAIREALRDERVVGGNFRIRFGRSKHARFLAAFYHVIRQVRMYYGDSALFCRSGAFAAAGGFPPFPIMEDLAFAQRLHRLGRMAYLEGPVHASPRRWEQGGIAQAWASWIVIQTLYFLHVPPERLALLYRHIR